MVMSMRAAMVMLLFLSAGCAIKPNLPAGAAAYGVVPVHSPEGAIQSYRIGPLDTIAVTVFQEPDLSVRDLQVDAGGRVIIPLIGEMQAGGKTSNELGQEIVTKLQNKYLERPQVSVTVQQSVSQRVTVQGSVIQAGVYEIKGRTTLLEALAMARGLARTAALDEVAIFRVAGGKRTGALFDVSKIYRGQADDPEILGRDIVIVGRSNIKSAWLDLLTASPLIGVIRR